jgi:hypothetical protein
MSDTEVSLIDEEDKLTIFIRISMCFYLYYSICMENVFGVTKIIFLGRVGRFVE